MFFTFCIAHTQTPISQLPSMVGTPQITDYVPITNQGITKKAMIYQLFTAMGVTGGGGSVTGTPAQVPYFDSLGHVTGDDYLARKINGNDTFSVNVVAFEDSTTAGFVIGRSFIGREGVALIWANADFSERIFFQAIDARDIGGKRFSGILSYFNENTGVSSQVIISEDFSALQHTDENAHTTTLANNNKGITIRHENSQYVLPRTSGEYGQIMVKLEDTCTWARAIYKLIQNYDSTKFIASQVYVDSGSSNLWTIYLDTLEGKSEYAKISTLSDSLSASIRLFYAQFTSSKFDSVSVRIDSAGIHSDLLGDSLMAVKTHILSGERFKDHFFFNQNVSLRNFPKRHGSEFIQSDSTSIYGFAIQKPDYFTEDSAKCAVYQYAIDTVEKTVSAVAVTPKAFVIQNNLQTNNKAAKIVGSASFGIYLSFDTTDRIKYYLAGDTPTAENQTFRAHYISGAWRLKFEDTPTSLSGKMKLGVRSFTNIFSADSAICRWTKVDTIVTAQYIVNFLTGNDGTGDPTNFLVQLPFAYSGTPYMGSGTVSYTSGNVQPIYALDEFGEARVYFKSSGTAETGFVTFTITYSTP